MSLRLAASTAVLALLAACTPQAGDIVSAPAPREASAPESREEPVWAFEQSDIPLDPAFRFGQLANGMRYAVRQNATPAGSAIVRMEVATGSLDEEDHEQGFAHFVEHMAFNGSTRVPEGEMIHLLERKGLAFGADTNASTGFETTTYKLDLPRNDPELLDTALMLMRETASELLFDSAAVEREKGVVLAEMRDRNDWRLRDAIDNARFVDPEARYTRRFPIGTAETLRAATAEGLRAFWQREYVPEHTTVIVIGDFDPALMEAEIARHFATWQPAPAEPQPSAGPVLTGDSGRTDIHLDPALSERVTAVRHGPWLDEPDSIEQRKENLLRQIGYSIVNRRLQRLSRLSEPPFRSAGYGTGNVFKVGRTTRLIVETQDGHWREGLTAALLEMRRAQEFGFAAAEVAEQVAIVRKIVENQAASAHTRSHSSLANSVFSLLRDGVVPSNPRTVLERFEAFAPEITVESVTAALERDTVPLDDPLLRFRGRRAPEGGAEALRSAWDAAMDLPIERSEAAVVSDFHYDQFGTPGEVVADSREPQLGIREIRFANGVMLNLKPTKLEDGKVYVELSIDGGEKLNTREAPLATEMTRFLPIGGLGKHSLDELQSILAGRTVGDNIDAKAERFVSTAQTTPDDLALQLRLLAALVTDPGYRREGEIKFRNFVDNYFAQLNATPSLALRNAIGGIFSDGDPRFTLQNVEDYRALDFAKLRKAISGRLENGAVEIGIVGDFDEGRAIALVAETFGALPSRETTFRTYDDQPLRPFTADRSRRIVRHSGPDDQALLRLTWPTRDDSDAEATVALKLLERVVRLEITGTLREKLGQAYSPSAASSPSAAWKGYGTFGIAASVDVAQVSAAREAIMETIRQLRAQPVDDDILRRARQPMLERYDNALKSNRGWIGLVDRAQTEAFRIDRYLQAPDRLKALTGADVQAMAQTYLDPEAVLEVLVLPEGAVVPE